MLQFATNISDLRGKSLRNCGGFQFFGVAAQRLSQIPLRGGLSVLFQVQSV
jgi:hypothetical protein